MSKKKRKKKKAQARKPQVQAVNQETTEAAPEGETPAEPPATPEPEEETEETAEVKTSEAEETEAEETEAEAPAVEEPAPEGSASEESAVAEPVPEESATEEPAPEESKTEESAAEAPVYDGPVPGEPEMDADFQIVDLDLVQGEDLSAPSPEEEPEEKSGKKSEKHSEERAERKARWRAEEFSEKATEEKTGDEPKKERPIKCVPALTGMFFLFISLFFQEVIFHISLSEPITWEILYPLLSSLVLGGVLGWLISLIRKAKVRRIFTILFLVFFMIFFWVHLIYYSVFVTFWAPFSMLSVAGQAFDFMDMILDNVGRQLFWMIPMALPLLGYLIFVRKRDRKLPTAKEMAGSAAIWILAAVWYLTLVLAGGTDADSPYDLIVRQSSISLSVERLGTLSSGVFDGIFGGKDSDEGMEVGGMSTPDMPVTLVAAGEETGTESAAEEAETQTAEAESNPAEEEAEPEEVFVPEPRVMEIDFDKYIESTNDKTLKSLHQYFRDETPSYTNEYTGMFEGYNLIWITAEGMSKYIIDEERTPTLYKLSHEGFVFEHYYSPLWYGSTSGGEWANLTGTSPGNGGAVAMVQSGRNGTDLYFTPGRRFSALGYQTVGFHNNSYTYYDRNLSHPNMNLTWIATGTGYDPEVAYGKPIWPQPDSRLWEESKKYLDFRQPFYAYYMTVSGHAGYNWSGNMMSVRHRDLVQDLPYGETTKAYLACHYELEMMLTQMLADLEAEGILDKTVIVLATDHIPYNNMDVCDEVAGHALDKAFEQYENTLILWSGAMEEPVTVEKYCSSIDILPTVLNLFGVEYDSRLLGGRDILSDSPQLVMFNGSYNFISDKCMYNAKSGEITLFEGHTEDEITKEYIDQMKTVIRNKAKLSGLILGYDYYHILFKDAENGTGTQEQENIGD